MTLGECHSKAARSNQLADVFVACLLASMNFPQKSFAARLKFISMTFWIGELRNRSTTPSSMVPILCEGSGRRVAAKPPVETRQTIV